MPNKPPKKDTDEKQEVNASLAAVKKISVDTTAAAPLLELGGIFTLR